MSGTPDELPDPPLSPEEAEMLANALEPLGNVSGAAGFAGGALEDAPGTANKFSGTMLQQVAAHIDVMQLSVQSLLRSLQLYDSIAAGDIEQAFPPPEIYAQQVQGDLEPLQELLQNPEALFPEGGGGPPGPFPPGQE